VLTIAGIIEAFNKKWLTLIVGWKDVTIEVRAINGNEEFFPDVPEDAEDWEEYPELDIEWDEHVPML
jgi:hypothetical protein